VAAGEVDHPISNDMQAPPAIHGFVENADAFPRAQSSMAQQSSRTEPHLSAERPGTDNTRTLLDAGQHRQTSLFAPTAAPIIAAQPARLDGEPQQMPLVTTPQVVDDPLESRGATTAIAGMPASTTTAMVTQNTSRPDMAVYTPPKSERTPVVPGELVTQLAAPTTPAIHPGAWPHPPERTADPEKLLVPAAVVNRHSAGAPGVVAPLPGARPPAQPPVGAHPRVIHQAETTAPAPTIQVTIGRVEVRAVQPTPAPPLRQPPRAAPKVSLEEYLHGQRGGQR
jgi:hypothetical protein